MSVNSWCAFFLIITHTLTLNKHRYIAEWTSLSLTDTHKTHKCSILQLKVNCLFRWNQFSSFNYIFPSHYKTDSFYVTNGFNWCSWLYYSVVFHIRASSIRCVKVSQIKIWRVLLITDKKVGYCAEMHRRFYNIELTLFVPVVLVSPSYTTKTGDES